MGLTIHDTEDLYLDKRQREVCGKSTYRLGLESGDKERGDKEPLICNPCLITIRRDMHTEFDLRQKVQSLNTKVWLLGVAFPLTFGVVCLLIGKYLL
jgi:hypothetical protein